MANIGRALTRARLSILTVAITYVLSVVFGAVLVHTGNAFALGQYDSLRERVNATTDPTLKALDQGNRLQAALYDFGGNLVLGALPGTVAGMCVVCFYPLAAYRGWIGGIVSVDDAHASRLADPAEAAYYLITLVLQLIPYTLAGAAGVNLGLALLRPAACYQGEKWWIVPKEALRDAARLYVLVVPLFAVASLWEFLAR
jgi:hypothetical protein